MTNSTSRIEEVCELLRGAVTEVFGTMLSTEAHPIAPGDSQRTGEPLVAGTVGFMGELNGVVYLSLNATFARVLACRLLDMREEEFEDDAMINDAIGEVSNMVVGAVKSRLCDDGFPCVLTIPTIVRGTHFSVDVAGYSDRRSLAFRCGDDQISVTLLMKPPGDQA